MNVSISNEPASSTASEFASTPSTPPVAFAAWRLRGIGLLRIVFGLVWAIDAWFKWQPGFIHNFETYLRAGGEGQSAAVQGWIGFWVRTVNVNPHAFAYVVASAETALALGLILGVFSNLVNLGGLLLSVVIWSTAEGFGGPYKPGSADIGAAVIYALVFLGLFLSRSGLFLGLDGWLTPRLGRLGALASGSLADHEG